MGALDNVDALPELSRPGAGTSSGNFRIEPIGTDKFGRTVARVHARSGDLSRLMVRNGYARAAYGADYAEEETRARRGRAGLWAGPGIPSPAAHRARAAGIARN